MINAWDALYNQKTFFIAYSHTNITKVERDKKNEMSDHVRIWVKVIGIYPLAYTNTDLNHTSNSTFSILHFYSVSIILLLPNEKCDAESFPI